jgi:hypothetical protein
MGGDGYPATQSPVQAGQSGTRKVFIIVVVLLLPFPSFPFVVVCLFVDDEFGVVVRCLDLRTKKLNQYVQLPSNSCSRWVHFVLPLLHCTSSIKYHCHFCELNNRLHQAQTIQYSKSMANNYHRYCDIGSFVITSHSMSIK